MANRVFERACLAAGAALMVTACAVDSNDPVAPGSASFSATAAGAESVGQEVAFTGNYMILGRAGRLPANLDSAVRTAGGRLTSVIPEIGVAFAAPIAPDFLTRIRGVAGVESVAPDVMLEWVIPGTLRGEEVVAEAVQAEVAGPWDNETFYSFQWAPRAVQAPEAWAAGYTGQGVRVAILDGAIYSGHLDLAPNLDVAASRSFVPGVNWNVDTGTFWHGTHVAGIVAARANNIGTVGIAPNATLIGVKVLHSGSGAFEWILNGIIYAARPLAQGGAGAHIINMSLGATIDYRGNWMDRDFRDAFRDLQTAYDRGTRWAYQQGVTVIASAGNGGTNFDTARNLFKFPAENQHVVSVSATGPHGWALGASDFERPAYYTDHGKSLVTIAAPGGTLGLWVVDGYDGLCTVTGTFRTITNWCEVFDQVLSTVRGTTTASYNWAQGTSMAAPAAAGVAALIIERMGGRASPAQVRTRLQQSAADLGKPGHDEFYGHGWINAYRAIQ